MFNKEKINDLANNLLIGLTEDETNMILSEFNEINESIELISDFDNISDVVPSTYPYDVVVTSLRSGNEVSEEIDNEKLLSNCDNHESRVVVIPKVVG